MNVISSQLEDKQIIYFYRSIIIYKISLFFVSYICILIVAEKPVSLKFSYLCVTISLLNQTINNQPTNNQATNRRPTSDQPTNFALLKPHQKGKQNVFVLHQRIMVNNEIQRRISFNVQFFNEASIKLNAYIIIYTVNKQSLASEISFYL